MEENERFSLDHECIPDFMRGVGKLIHDVHDRDIQESELFALEVALRYAADDLEQHVKDALHMKHELHKLKGGQTA